MIYQMLSEPFSARNGLALAGIAANVMRFDEEGMVVCPAADESWGVPMSRVLVIPAIALLNRVRGWRYVPLWVRRRVMERVFRPLLTRLRPGDVVWFHNWYEVAEVLQLRVAACGAKLLYHVHNSHGAYAAGGGFARFAPDSVIFISEAMRQEVLALSPGVRHTVTIHNGSDESRFYPASQDGGEEGRPPMVLFVGRLVEAKGVHVLLAAMRLLEERGVAVRCRVIGSAHAGSTVGRETSYIRSLRAMCPANTQMVGFRTGTAIAEEFRASDILCCPSVWQEPFGLVNIEAMGCGLAVVASRVGGIPEIAADGGVLLVEPNDATLLADALERVVKDGALRARLGAEGLASFRQRFTTRVSVGRYLAVAAALAGPEEARQKAERVMVG